MSVSTYQNIHLLLPKDDLKNLKRRAESENMSVAELIRNAVRRVYGGTEPDQKKQAFKRLARSNHLKVDNWDIMKSELLKRYG